MPETTPDTPANVASAAATITEAINNKPPEYIRRKTDNIEFSVSDFEKAVTVLKELRAKEETSVDAIEAVGELEDKRLNHWLVKVVVYSILTFLCLIVGTIGYATITGVEIAIPDYLATVISSVKDIALAIMETK